MSGKKLSARILLTCLLLLGVWLVYVQAKHAKQQLLLSRLGPAQGDIHPIESALVKTLHDSGCETLAELFTPGAVHTSAGGAPGVALTTAQFQVAVSIYSQSFYALLKDGRMALNSMEHLEGTSVALQPLLNSDRVRRLGSSYINLVLDRWGNRYNIYPGPWPDHELTIPFRIYKQDEATLVVQDVFTVMGDCIEDAGLPKGTMRGFPAPLDKIAYIWSNGENLRSDQATYSTAPGETPHATGACAHYDPENGGPEYFGGGDDINNWDIGSSWSAFY